MCTLKCWNSFPLCGKTNPMNSACHGCGVFDVVGLFGEYEVSKNRVHHLYQVFGDPIELDSPSILLVHLIILKHDELERQKRIFFRQKHGRTHGFSMYDVFQHPLNHCINFFRNDRRSIQCNSCHTIQSVATYRQDFLQHLRRRCCSRCCSRSCSHCY